MINERHYVDQNKDNDPEDDDWYVFDSDVAMQLFDRCREGFNQRFTILQLLMLAKACKASEWDFWPDQWDERQIEEAIRYGRVPTWGEIRDEKIVPTFDSKMPKRPTTGNAFTRSVVIRQE